MALARLHVQIPKGLMARLRRYAAVNEVSIELLVCSAVAAYLKERE